MVDIVDSAMLAMSAVPAIVPRVARDTMQIPFWVELFTIVAASASGTISARANRLDLVGAVTLAIITGLSGGLLRDMTLQVGDVYLLNQPMALPACCITALVIFVIPFRGRRIDLVMQAIDILNVGLYCAMGTDKAWAYGFSIPACLLMGAFTGVGGGVIRDMCLAQRPALFNLGGNLYAIAALLGSVGYVVARSFTSMTPTEAAIVCTAITIVVRWASVRFDIKSPGPMDLPSYAVRQVHDYRVRHQQVKVSGKAGLGDDEVTAEQLRGTGSRPERERRRTERRRNDRRR